MADETIEVVDDGVVTIDITNTPELAPPDEPVEPVVAAPAPKPPRERQQKSNAAEEAAAALSQAVKTAETEAAARKAAEATAAAERSQREAAQRLAEQRAQEAKGYREQAEESALTVINSNLENAKREMSTAESEIERFMEAGEFSKASKAQGQLARAAAAVDRLEAQKTAFEGRVPTTEGRVEAPAQLTQVDQYLSQMGSRAQSWLRAHPECLPADLPGGGGNAVSNAKMMQGHFAAKAKGLAEGSEAYFHVIEEHTGHREPTVEADTAPVSSAAAVVQAEPARAAPKPVRAAPTAAPVSRDAPGPNGAPTSRTITLTTQEQEIARLSFQQKPGEDEDAYRRRANQMYAVEKIKMIAEGKYGRTTH